MWICVKGEKAEVESTHADDARRTKARQLRYKKAIIKDLNIEAIKGKLWEISEACDDVKYFWEGGDDTLLDALLGDDECEVEEFRNAICTLSADCEQMFYDLNNVYIPECFDIFFGAVDTTGEMMGFDPYEGDYFGLSGYEKEWGTDENVKKLERMTKKDLIEAMQCCFSVARQYLALIYRYDSLKASMDVLQSKNTGLLNVIKEIDKAYDECEKVDFYVYSKEVHRFDSLIKDLPQQVWIQ